MPSSAGQTCALDRKSTRLNSSHTIISYAVFCLKKTQLTRIGGGVVGLLQRGEQHLAPRAVGPRRRAQPPLARLAPVGVDGVQPRLFFFLRTGPPRSPPLSPPPFAVE